MTVRHYSSSAGKMVLQLGITAVATAMQVDTTAGLPGTTPFSLLVDIGLPTEEIVTVTQVSGNTLVVTRGVDGTSAQPHASGAVVRHGIIAQDLRDSRNHENASSGVHGITGNVVGTSDTQGLTNKDLSSPTNTFPSTLATDAELAAHSGATVAHGATGAVVGTTNTQTLTNKNLSSGTNIFPASLATDAELTAHTGATAAHGVAGAVVGTTDTQTLTNKTMSGASNTFSNIPQGAVVGLGTWTDYTSSVRTDVGSSAAAGTTVQVARFMNIGNTVWAYGEATATSLVNNASVMLPAAAGTPKRRFLNCGTMIVTEGSGTANPAQLGIARMTTGLDRVLTITDTNAFCDAPAGSSIQWNVCYEVN